MPSVITNCASMSLIMKRGSIPICGSQKFTGYLSKLFGTSSIMRLGTNWDCDQIKSNILRGFSSPEQLNRWPCHWLSHSLTFTFALPKSSPRDLRPLRHLISVMRRHYFQKKNHIFRKISYFHFFFRFSEKFQIFKKHSDFLKTLRFL